ncbi:MAG: response regulator [Clostridia bacterium]|nr:response regulator [Clostridia bacterium]
MNILIVDDEVSVRKSLSYVINNEFGGKCRVITSNSAETALKTAEKKEIDLLISDICLGNMNGIELSRKILDIYPKCKIIYISAYDEKDYLKAAISMKVLGYIEKPIDKNQILRIVSELLIDEENRTSKIDLYTNIEKNEHFIDLLLKDEKNDEVKALYRKSYLYDCPYYSVVCFAGKVLLDVSARNKLVNMVAVDLHERKIKFELQTRNEFIIVAGGREYTLISKLRECILSAFEQLNLKDKVIVGIGSVKRDWYEISSSYKSALAGLNKGFFEGYNIYSSINAEFDFKDLNIFETTNTFWELLEKQKEDLLIDYVRHMAKKIKQEENISKQTAVRLIEAMAYQINLYSERNNILLSRSAYIDVNSDFLFDEMIKSLEKLIREFCNENRIADNIVTLTKKFIMENYKRTDLSIKDVADSVHLNVSYLSTHFKKVCGITINSYLTEFRIEKAKEYIRSSRYNADEIGRLVGYEDGNYFYRIFKKQTGMTTKEYRKSVGK